MAKGGRNGQLAAIHIARAQLGLPEDSYRALVRLASGGVQQPDGSVRGGQDSAAALSWRQRGVLLDALRKRLAKRASPAGAVGTGSPALNGGDQRKVQRGPDAVDAVRKDVAAKIEALLLDAGRGDAYANGIARTRFGADRWEWLPFDQLEALMQMLILDQTRRVLRRIMAALAAGEPWRARLSSGELQEGVHYRALREGGRRGWLAGLPEEEVGDDPLRWLALTEAGRDESLKFEGRSVKRGRRG